MTKTELKKYREMLEQKQLRLNEKPDRNEIAVTRSADPLDEVQSARERDLVIRKLDRDALVLREVRTALQRIENGSFGVCLDCEEDISPARLKAVPWAERCVNCQERADQKPSSAEEAA